MCIKRWQCLTLMVALVGVLGVLPAQAGPLAVIANFTDPGLTASGPPWPGGTVTVIDTATDQLVGSPLVVGANPMAVAITPNGKMAVVACAQSSELYFISLPVAGDGPEVLPKVTGKLSVGSGSGDTFYPAGLSVSPDGKYVAVTSTVGGQQRSTQISRILVVQLESENGPILASSLNLNDAESGFTAEATAIGPKSIIIVGPSANPPVIFALSYADGVISFPEPDDNNTQMGAFQNATGFNVTLSPDNKFAVVPLGGGAVNLFRIDDAGKLTVAKELINSGGTGAHSAAFSPDGKTLYVRNFLPSRANIAVFQFNAETADLVPTGQLICPGIPPAIVALSSYTQGALGYVGSQTLAVTPDGKKIYAANPFGGAPLAAYLFLYGAGNVVVYDAGNPAPAKTLALGRNPIAVAIQPQPPAAQ